MLHHHEAYAFCYLTKYWTVRFKWSQLILIWTIKSLYASISLKTYSLNKRSYSQREILLLTSVRSRSGLYYTIHKKINCLGADYDSKEESTAILVTTAVQPPRLNCPEAKPQGHGMISILKCFGIFQRATKPKDMGLMKQREWPRGVTWESKFPASDFSCTKLLGKQKGLAMAFSYSHWKRQIVTSSNASEQESYIKWKIIASIFSGALLK